MTLEATHEPATRPAVRHPHARRGQQPSPIVKRSVVIEGRKTSISLERPFFDHLKVMAARQGRTLSSVLGEIDHNRTGGNLSSAIRLAVFADALATPAALPPASTS